ncbi:MAG: hypothetical protein AAF657_09365 [Acidobacteriota bacterium]
MTAETNDPKSGTSRPVRTAARGATFRPLEAAEMAALARVLKRCRPHLEACAGVERVDIGYRWCKGKMTGEVAIRAHVGQKVDPTALSEKDRVPRQLEGFPVDVIQSRVEPHRRRRRNPLVGGIEIRNVEKAGVGTLGAVVWERATGDPMALTNHHVLAKGRPQGGRDEPVNQPGTTGGRDRIGRVDDSDAFLDCAVARIEGSRGVSSTILDFPGGLKGFVEPALGLRVTKSGRTTGTTVGMIEGVSEHELTVVPLPGEWQELSLGGDSGSVWLEEESHAAVGLHWGGESSEAPEDERAFAKRIDQVAEALKVDLFRQAELQDGTRQAPSLVQHDDRLVLGWVDSGDLRPAFRRSRDGFVFGDAAVLEQASPAGPALVSFGGQLVAALVGLGNNRITILRSADATSWQTAATLDQRSSTPPSLAVFRRRLYLAWRDADDGRLRLARSRDGVDWSDQRSFDHRAAHGPALAATGSRLLLAWPAEDRRLQVARSRDGWAFRSRVTLDESTAVRPALAVHGRRVHLAWLGTGAPRLHWASSKDGRRWERAVRLRYRAASSPALAGFGDSLALAWSAADPPHPLQLLLFDPE